MPRSAYGRFDAYVAEKVALAELARRAPIDVASPQWMLRWVLEGSEEE